MSHRTHFLGGKRLKPKCWELILFFQPTDPLFNCSQHQTIETNGFITSIQYLCVIQHYGYAGFFNCEGIVWVYFFSLSAMSLCNLSVLSPIILKKPTTFSLTAHWLQLCVRPHGCDDMRGLTDSVLIQRHTQSLSF